MNRYIYLLPALLMLSFVFPPPVHAEPDTATGIVYHDQDEDGTRDGDEPGIEGVRVSNGEQVVRTDADGRYELPVDGDTILFVCKPQGWIYPTDDRQMPQFYYIHKPDGSPDEQFKYEGSKPTGPLPESVDFPLYRYRSKESFRAVLMGDPQPASMEEVRYYGRDIMSELVDVEASFGLTLGDIVGNNLDLFEPMNELQALPGIPWHNLAGNHDLNFRAQSDTHANETFHRVYGPTNYAFQYGRVHVIPLDNVVYHGHEEGGYHGGLNERQLRFVENYLHTVPEDHHIVIASHIPLVVPDVGKRHSTPQLNQLMQILSGFNHTSSFSAHTHKNAIYHVGKDSGYHPEEHGVHLHHNLGTASGTWWKGPLDERGIPLTPMRDGTPNGYAIATFDGNKVRVRWKAANHSSDHQMNIMTPDHVHADHPEDDGQPTEVLVNVFNGGPDSEVHMRVRGQSDWTEMSHEHRLDPSYVRLHRIDQETPMKGTSRLKPPHNSRHIWVGHLPENLPRGTHLIEVKAEDAYGHTFHNQRPVRVE